MEPHELIRGQRVRVTRRNHNFDGATGTIERIVKASGRTQAHVALDAKFMGVPFTAPFNAEDITKER